MTELLIALACLIGGTAGLCWCDRNMRQMLRHRTRMELHKQTIRSLFAGPDQVPTGCAHYVRRRKDIKPVMAHIERHDPVLGYLPSLIVPQAY